MRFIRQFRIKARQARRLRFKSFVDDLRSDHGSGLHPLKVLDVGGTPSFWQDWWGVDASDQMHVTLINNHHIDHTQKYARTDNDFIENVNQDANELSTEYMHRYDLIFSNSFFEHLKSRQQQEALARKIVDSEVPYFIQVPNKYSPIDPHHPFAPFFALYPFELRSRLLLFSGFGSSGRSKTLEDARRREQYYNPLGPGDMRRLFPEAQLQIEKPMGIPMSILVHRP